MIPATNCLIFGLALLSVLTGVNGDRICETKDGKITCRDGIPTGIKAAIGGGIVVVVGLVVTTIYVVRQRRIHRRMQESITEIEQSQVHGPPLTTYGAPPNASYNRPAPQRPMRPPPLHTISLARTAMPATLSVQAESQSTAPMVFAGASGTPHFPHSAVGNGLQPHTPRRARKDDDGGHQFSGYPFVGISSKSPPSPGLSDISSMPPSSYPGQPRVDIKNTLP
ncbi:hypothetical protein HGRIS_010675 [Hohenbuehelia grisea]|uniref:Uncharacterized protein n=1 Tax=Hohenbuehelia grisea TaxID=104357 RepID=A0ABR3IXL6_9AGAR